MIGKINNALSSELSIALARNKYIPELEDQLEKAKSMSFNVIEQN